MKKVRFESPKKVFFDRMDEPECHSPRPFLERQAPIQAPEIYEPKRVVYSSDPVHRFEYADSSPYPVAKKTALPTYLQHNKAFVASDEGPKCFPSNDLNLSILDVHEPRPCISSVKLSEKRLGATERPYVQDKVLSAIENTANPPNVLVKDDNFFIKRDNLEKFCFDVNPIQQQLSKLNFLKENGLITRKAEIAKSITQNLGKENIFVNINSQEPIPAYTNSSLISDCNCHHCIRVQNKPQHVACSKSLQKVNRKLEPPLIAPCQTQIVACCHCDQHEQKVQKLCHCMPNSPQNISPQNAIDKKTWAIQKLEQNKKSECMELDKQTNLAKEKREPTISDLLKIIKLQNEQLQLLQDKVDKFITASTNQPQMQAPTVQNIMTEHVALQTIDSEHKISIGVMTSFEMVCTSTVINKQAVQTNDNAQIQCNKSQISIKEVVSKQPMNFNILEGIIPVTKASNKETSIQLDTELEHRNRTTNTACGRTMNEEKTLNELSLYNVQVDNATTPMMSPEQSLYLDVRDYSDSESTSSDEQSKVGWTYYNKVMTHVNGMLEDSDMPSSASALYRNTRKQCVQMQIDKTNVSVTKRVKFGDDPLGLHQPHIYAASDTSLKMNQLAAKYLKTASVKPRPAKPINQPVEMSFATRNYMERHKLLQGIPPSAHPAPAEMPRFLDITALKKQPKFI